MRILVTGARGFVGAEVVKQLLDHEHHVIAVDRTPAANGFRASERGPGRLSVEVVDLADGARVHALLDAHRPEATIHLAWYAQPGDYLVSSQNLESLPMTVRLVEAALSSGCRKFVMAGTCVEYAVKDSPLVEDDPADPRSLYAACKHAAWWVVRDLAAVAGAELSWGRIFHIHGPGEDQRRLVPWVARELRAGRTVELTDGTQVRDHLHVADVAAGLTTLLAPGAAGIYNVCSGQPVTLRQVLDRVGEIIGRRDLLRFGARPHRLGEIMYLAGD